MARKTKLRVEQARPAELNPEPPKEAREALEVRAEKNGAISIEEIASRAYTIYEREGRVDGRDMEHWLRAELELKSESLGQRPSLQAGSHASQSTAPRSARLQKASGRSAGSAA